MNNSQPISETLQMSRKLTGWIQYKLSWPDYNSLRQTAVKIIAGCHCYDFLKTNLNFLSFGVNKLAPKQQAVSLVSFHIVGGDYTRDRTENILLFQRKTFHHFDWKYFINWCRQADKQRNTG